MANDGSGEQIFFLYDHSFLQSEEDDIKDAIIYFHPTSVLEDIQWALCGQLMGVVEFFKRFKANYSATKVFCLRYNKFAVRSVSHYSMVLGGHFSDPDSVLQEQLDFMHRLFEFYHKSLPEVLQSSNTRSQKLFLQGICDSFLALIRYYGDGLSTAFNAVPWLNLQKGQIDVQLHATYLLQCCQKTEGVYSGCLFFKNKLLFSQLHMSLVLPLLIIRTHQNNLPCQPITSDSELHQGVRLIRIYLDDSQFKLLSSGNLPSKCLSSSGTSKSKIKEQSDTVPKHCEAQEPTRLENISEIDFQENKVRIDEPESNSGGNLSTDLFTADRETFDSVSTELTVNDLIVENKCSIDEPVGSPDVKTDSKDEEGESDKPEDALTLSQLSSNKRIDNASAKEQTLNFGSPQSRDENTQVDHKKKKTILKSKPKNAKALPKTLDIFRAVKLKLKESKAEEKLSSLMWNANHSSSEELFAPVTKPLSLIDLNTEESPTNASSESPKTRGFYFRSPKANISASQDGGKTGSKGFNKKSIISPKSASMSEISGKTLNIAERLKMSGGSSFSSGFPATKSKSDAAEPSLFDKSTDGSYLSNSTRSVILQTAGKERRAEKEHNQKRNVSFQESFDSQSKPDITQSNENDVDVGLPTEANSDVIKEKELHELDLYIQSHSDILLLLFMEKDASLNSDNLKELWRNALPQLGNLDALVKQCSEITELSRDQNYFFLTFDKVQKQLSGNMLWPITAPQSEFSDSVVDMRDEFKRNPDIHDITWRTHSYSTFGHQGPLKETFYQNQMPFLPTFSPLVERDSRICLDTKAQKQLAEDHGITLL